MAAAVRGALNFATAEKMRQDLRVVIKAQQGADSMNHFLRKKIHLLFPLSAFVLLVCQLPVAAQTAGYDLLQTGSGASVDLSSLGLGTVPLQGVPIQTSLGNTDTIMHRTQDTVGGGQTPVVVTALFMKSKSSVTYNNQQVDVYVTINNSNGAISTSVLPQPDTTSSSGTVTVYSGGTFDSSITINADLIFVKAGTSVTNSANYVGHQQASAITLTSTGSSWSSTPPAGYPSSSTFPSGGFYPRPVHNGPHPVVPSSCNTGGGGGTPTPQPVANAKVARGPQGNATAIATCISAQ
jgi:hypothetical protein